MLKYYFEMEKNMQKLFGNIKMTWTKVIIFALVIGIYVGLIMDVNPLYQTSFQDIGVTHEWWTLFAIIIVVNCNKNIEAALKCFVFFLISQPVIFATEAIIGHISQELAIHYLLIWAMPIILTLPGGFIAYYCKKENIFGDIVLGLGNSIEVMLGIYYTSQAIKNFPKHILTALFCFFVFAITNIYIKKTKKDRLISILTTIIVVGALVAYLTATHKTFL